MLTQAESCDQQVMFKLLVTLAIFNVRDNTIFDCHQRHEFIFSHIYSEYLARLNNWFRSISDIFSYPSRIFSDSVRNSEIVQKRVSFSMAC